MFFSKTKDSPCRLAVGLGNPGLRYENTRHNAGFLVLDRLAEKLGCSLSKVKAKAYVGEAKIGGTRVILAKPQTYMNLSGDSVAELARFYKIRPEHIVVISDDVTLPVGKIRVRKNGSHGGQNGLRHIIERLGTQDFPRVRVGVGDRPHPDTDLADWVLSKFRPEEQAPLDTALTRAAEAALLVLQGKADEAMNRFNGA